jgi:hypothetical protein
MSFLDRSFKRSTSFLIVFLSIFAVAHSCSARQVWDEQSGRYVSVHDDYHSTDYRARQVDQQIKNDDIKMAQKTLRALQLVQERWADKKNACQSDWKPFYDTLHKTVAPAAPVDRATGADDDAAPVVTAVGYDELDFTQYPELSFYIDTVKTKIGTRSPADQTIKQEIDNFFTTEANSLRDSLDGLRSSNVFLQTLLPRYRGGAVKGIPNKIALAILSFVADPLQKSVDSNLRQVFDVAIKKAFRSLRKVGVMLGLASPLPAQTVASWSVVVKNYAAIMEKLGKAQVTDQGVTDMYAQRAANRPTKQTPKVSAEGGENPVVVVRAEENLDELAMFMKKAPRYVSISESFVRQMSNQINGIMHDMGDNYVDQREILSDILNTLDDVGKMIRSSYEKDNQPVLTQKLNGDLMACCSWLTSQLGALQDMINVDSEKSTPATTDSDPYGYGSSLRKR